MFYEKTMTLWMLVIQNKKNVGINQEELLVTRNQIKHQEIYSMIY